MKVKTSLFVLLSLCIFNTYSMRWINDFKEYYTNLTKPSYEKLLDVHFDTMSTEKIISFIRSHYSHKDQYHILKIMLDFKEAWQAEKFSNMSRVNPSKYKKLQQTYNNIVPIFNFVEIGTDSDMYVEWNIKTMPHKEEEII